MAEKRNVTLHRHNSHHLALTETARPVGVVEVKSDPLPGPPMIIVPSGKRIRGTISAFMKDKSPYRYSLTFPD